MSEQPPFPPDAVPPTDNLLPPFPPRIPRPNPFRFLLDHNPCFLLSALLMFVGCYLINSALNVRTGDTAKAFELLGAINLYEIALLLLGVTLLRRAAWNRDGVFLLLIEMLFLADAPFLLAQIAMAKEHWLSTFNLLLFLAVIAKSGFALHALRIPLRPRTLGFLLLQLAMIYCGLPLFLSHVATDGVIGAAPMYIAWWAVGLLPLAYDLLARIDMLPDSSENRGSHLVVRRAYLVIPWLLLIAHLAFFQYAYRSPFFGGDLSPVLLGLAVATLGLKPTKAVSAGDLRTLRTLLCAIAFVLSLPADALQWQGTLLSFTLSPQWITFATTTLIFAYFFHARAALATLAFYAVAMLLHLYGPRPSTVFNAAGNTIADVLSALYRVARWIVPQTAIGWGITAILAAFGLLALGAYYTLRRPAPPEVAS